MIASDLNLSEVQLRTLATCSVSSAAHAKCFFPETFFSPFNILHKEMLRLIDSPKKRVVIAAPRGLGKTSTVLFGRAARNILFQQTKFFVFLTNSSDIAVLQTENLKHELLSNIEIRKFFGPIDARQAEGIDERFSKKAWVTNGGTLVLPRGAGQQIRGILYHSRRPDLILIDDLEDKELIQSEEQRKKLKEWFYSDVMKCISRYDQDFKIIYIDTLKHEDSLLQDLLDSDEWESIRLDVCDDNYVSNAPTFMTTEEIKAEVAEHRKNGTLDIFYREMRNIPVAKETAVFKQKFFRYFSEDGENLRVLNANEETVELIKHRHLRTVVIVDPAKTVNIQAADSSIIGVSIDKQGGRIFVRETLSKKFTPTQIYDEAFKMCLRLRAFMLAVEVTSLHQFISQPIETEIRKRKLSIIYNELAARGKKEERVKELGSWYRRGYIFHNIVGCDKLEGQLLSFPRSKLWDEMDALAYILKIMSEYAMYFDPTDLTFEDLEVPDEAMFRELLPEPNMSSDRHFV